MSELKRWRHDVRAFRMAGAMARSMGIPIDIGLWMKAIPKAPLCLAVGGGPDEKTKGKWLLVEIMNEKNSWGEYISISWDQLTSRGVPDQLSDIYSRGGAALVTSEGFLVQSGGLFYDRGSRVPQPTVISDAGDLTKRKALASMNIQRYGHIMLELASGYILAICGSSIMGGFVLQCERIWPRVDFEGEITETWIMSCTLPGPMFPLQTGEDYEIKACATSDGGAFIVYRDGTMIRLTEDDIMSKAKVGKKMETLRGFENDTWAVDYFGCSGNRVIAVLHEWNENGEVETVYRTIHLDTMLVTDIKKPEIQKWEGEDTIEAGTTNTVVMNYEKTKAHVLVNELSDKYGETQGILTIDFETMTQEYQRLYGRIKDRIYY